VNAEMSNPEFSGPGLEETSLPNWYQLFLEAKERLQTQDSTILELTQKFEDLETRMRLVQYESFQNANNAANATPTVKFQGATNQRIQRRLMVYRTNCYRV
jgi:hypothetical protein